MNFFLLSNFWELFNYYRWIHIAWVTEENNSWKNANCPGTCSAGQKKNQRSSRCRGGNIVLSAIIWYLIRNIDAIDPIFSIERKFPVLSVSGFVDACVLEYTPTAITLPLSISISGSLWLVTIIVFVFFLFRCISIFQLVVLSGALCIPVVFPLLPVIYGVWSQVDRDQVELFPVDVEPVVISVSVLFEWELESFEFGARIVNDMLTVLA